MAKESRHSYLRIILYSVLFLAHVIYFYSQFGRTTQDSGLYINNSIYVSPFYPWVIKFFGLFVGAENYRWISILQFVFGFSALAYSSFTICRLMKLGLHIEFLFFISIMQFYLGPIGAFVLHIFSEAVSYPAFILIFSISIRFALEKQRKDLLILLLLTSILFLTRPQFVLIFGYIILLLIFVGLQQKERWLKIRYFLLVILVASISFFIPYTYNYARMGQFIGPQVMGNAGGNNVMFLAREEDKELFKDAKERRIFLNIYNKTLSLDGLKYCDRKKWRKISKQEIAKNLEFVSHYWRFNVDNDYAVNGFVTSLNRNINEARKGEECGVTDIERFANLDTRSMSVIGAFREEKINDWVVMNPILVDISKKLLGRHWKEFIHYKSYQFFWYYIGIPGFIIFSLISLLLLSRIRTYKQNPLVLYVLACYILMFCNSIMVTVFAPFYISTRYMIYHYSLFLGLFMLFLGLLERYINQRQKKSS